MMTLRLILVLMFTLAFLPAKSAVAPEEQQTVPAAPLPTEKPKDLQPSPAVVGSRGRMLYENHCTRCHTSVVHVREKRRANSLQALESWVRRWSTEEKLDWSSQDLIEVVDYLNHRYYKLPASNTKE